MQRMDKACALWSEERELKITIERLLGEFLAVRGSVAVAGIFGLDLLFTAKIIAKRLIVLTNKSLLSLSLLTINYDQVPILFARSCGRPLSSGFFWILLDFSGFLLDSPGFLLPLLSNSLIKLFLDFGNLQKQSSQILLLKFLMYEKG